MGVAVLMVLAWQAALMFSCTFCQSELRIAAIVGPPFVMAKQNDSVTIYSGFVQEFLSTFQSDDHSCTFKFVDLGGNAGEAKRNWHAVATALQKENADLGVGPFSKGKELDSLSQKKKIIFTEKFADHQGWTALVRKPMVHERDIIKESLTLFRPFKVEVWLAIVVAFAVVSVLMALVNLVNPYEWRNLYKRDKIPKTDANQLSPMGSILIVFSTLTWQGYEKTPRSVAGRVLLLFWVAFVAVTLITYVANMTNLLNCEAHERSREPQPAIRHPFGLMEKAGKDMKSGTVESWPLVEYLEAHSDRTVQKLADHLKTKGDNVATVEEGLKRVKNRKENYAFIVDTVIAKYLTRDDCDVMMVGTIDPGEMEGYAFAMLGSPHEPENIKECLGNNLESMTKNVDIQALWRKWDNEYKYGRCIKEHNPPAKVPPTPAFVAINVYQFCGPLALVALGLILCVLVTLGEVTVHYVSNKLKKVNILGASSPIEEERRLHDDLDDDLKA